LQLPLEQLTVHVPAPQYVTQSPFEHPSVHDPVAGHVKRQWPSEQSSEHGEAWQVALQFPWPVLHVHVLPVHCAGVRPVKGSGIVGPPLGPTPPGPPVVDDEEEQPRTRRRPDTPRTMERVIDRESSAVPSGRKRHLRRKRLWCADLCFWHFAVVCGFWGRSRQRPAVSAKGRIPCVFCPRALLRCSSALCSFTVEVRTRAPRTGEARPPAARAAAEAAARRAGAQAAGAAEVHRAEGPAAAREAAATVRALRC
jgi:hypothetical protein